MKRIVELEAVRGLGAGGDDLPPSTASLRDGGCSSRPLPGPLGLPDHVDRALEVVHTGLLAHISRPTRPAHPAAVLSLSDRAGTGQSIAAETLPDGRPSLLHDLYPEPPAVLGAEPPPFNWFFYHTWSLALEQQFYLIWPVVLILVGRRRLIPFALAVAAGSALARAWGVHWWLLVARCDGFAIGSVIAVLTLQPGRESRFKPEWLRERWESRPSLRWD